jgi:hypothetical protein
LKIIWYTQGVQACVCDCRELCYNQGMGRPPNNYSDTRKSAALIAYDICENNAVRAAQWCKEHNGFTVSHDQITRWAKGEFITEEVRNIATRLKGELADKFEDIAHKCVDMLPGRLDETGAKDLATIAAIATDKMRLLREQSTVNVQATMTHEQRLEALAKFAQLAQERKAIAEAQTIEAEFESEEEE